MEFRADSFRVKAKNPEVIMTCKAGYRLVSEIRIRIANVFDGLICQTLRDEESMT